MAIPEPLKSVISIVTVDDTSLAMPSANQHRSGQERVMEQVQSIRRTRSKSSSSRSASTSFLPLSPVSDFVFFDAVKSPVTTSNGSAFYGNGLSATLSQNKNISWHGVSNMAGSAAKRNTSASHYQYTRGGGPVGLVGAAAAGQTNSSRSEPDLAQQRSTQKYSQSQQRLVSSRSTFRTERPTSQVITSTTSQPQPPSTMTGAAHTKTSKSTGQTKTNAKFVSSQVGVSRTPSKPPGTECVQKSKVGSDSKDGGVADITMKEAVQYLSSPEEAFQHCGAAYIQHHTFTDDTAKDEVSKLNGIPPLTALLRSPSFLVRQAASAALRNLSYRSNSNKMEIHCCGAITEAVALLREADSEDLKKQLTGLLWNLSSAESLKPDLLKSALPVLMERVILPFTTGSDRNQSDAEAFYHTTGCLRNLSSAKQSSRQAMRKCRGLIDSLVGYVTDCVEAEKPDDKSVENCVCVLHNLTFQLEAEAPALFNRITALAKPVKKSGGQGDGGPIGCFSPQSKALERHFDFPVVEDAQPTGAGWLIHSKTMQNYLSLLGSSQHEETQEACCGALQNLTVNEGIVSGVMSQIIVQKLNGLQTIAPLLKSSKVNVQRNTVALVGNLTKNSNLHSAIARKALPELLSILSAGTKEGNESDDTLAMTCQTANFLLMKEPETCKHLLNSSLINSLNDLSQNEYFPKSRKGASLLLYNLWSSKDLQSFLKKQGMTKSSFVNDVTTAAHKSAQIVD